VLLLAGKNVEGEQHARRAVEGWAPVSAVGKARAGFVLGWALDNLGRFDEAERELRAALAGLQPHYPEAHPFYGHVLGELGVVLARRGQLAAAAEQLQRAVDIRRSSCGPDNPLLSLPLLNLGAVLQLQHREVEAVPIAFECLALVQQHGGSKNRLTPSVLLLLARTVPKVQDAELRQRQLTQVRAAVADLLQQGTPQRVEIERTLEPAK
jgi:tetratricopeptide (TPR) repeat protein